MLAFTSEPFPKAFRYTHSYFGDRPNRSIMRLSIQRPLPSMLILIFASLSTSTQRVLVNWLSWSVLKISGVPYVASASSKASTQNSASMLLDSRGNPPIFTGVERYGHAKSSSLVNMRASTVYPVTAFETARQFCFTRVFGSS